MNRKFRLFSDPQASRIKRKILVYLQRKPLTGRVSGPLASDQVRRIRAARLCPETACSILFSEHWNTVDYTRTISFNTTYALRSSVMSVTIMRSHETVIRPTIYHKVCVPPYHLQSLGSLPGPCMQQLTFVLNLIVLHSGVCVCIKDHELILCCPLGTNHANSLHGSSRNSGFVSNRMCINIQSSRHIVSRRCRRPRRSIF